MPLRGAVGDVEGSGGQLGAFAVRASWRTADEAPSRARRPLTADADDVMDAPSPPGPGAHMLAGWQSLGPPESQKRWTAEAAALAENSSPPCDCQRQSAMATTSLHD